MVNCGPTSTYPAVKVCPELTDEDCAWLNRQLALAGHPPVTYARSQPAPPSASVPYQLDPTLILLRLPMERIR